MGFDFGQIGGIVSEVMDTDYIDIRRDIEGSLVEVYSNISCHIAYVSIDNPNPETVDIKPVIQALKIHTPLWVDIRNNDFIVAKKIGSDGSIQGVYSGRCGNSVVSMGRKVTMVSMISTEPYDPTPVPPVEPITVIVSYLYDTTQIIPDTVHDVEKGNTFTLEIPSIEGYQFSYYELDGVIQSGSTIVIPEVEEPHTIKIHYTVVTESDSFRFLVNGLYTKNDGSLANGWHTYKAVKIDSVSLEEGVYTIVSDNVTFEHEDNGRVLNIKKGTQLVLYPYKVFVTVDEVSISNDKATFTAKPFTPTEAQLNYYETRWYD